MPKTPAIERVVRGLERCGYHLFAVVSDGGLRGFMTLLPDGSTGRQATPRTEEKWRQEWLSVSASHPARTIAEHLKRTGRTELAVRAKIQMIQSLATQ